jgi:methyltransferase (TIGR00027 family)
LVLEKILGEFATPARAEGLIRSRYAEDRLEEAIVAGVKQYVILGAGLDSFAFRRGDLGPSLTVFELDHPATQRWKHEQLSAAGLGLPQNLVFVACNFERETAADALSRSSYSRDAPAFFSWLGTTFYLTRDALFETIESISSCAATGSEIVFDFAIPESCLGRSEQEFLDRARKAVARRGEPWLTSIEPEELFQQLEKHGLEVVESLSPDAQRERYLKDRSDELDVSGVFYLVTVRLATRAIRR